MAGDNWARGAPEAPAVTVVIPTRDRSTAVHEAVTSALQQHEVEVEVVVVDDGSTPPLRLDVAFGDRAVRVVRHARSLGPAAARNTGARFARGRWLAFLDDDDRWHPGKLQAQLAALDACPTVPWCLMSARQVVPSGRVVGVEQAPHGDRLLDELRHANVVPGGGSAVLVRTDAFAAVEGFDSRFRTLADWELWLRLAGTIGPPAVVDEPLVDYLLNPVGMLVGDEAVWREVDELEQKHDGADGRAPVVVDRVRFEHYLGYRRNLARRRGVRATPPRALSA